MSSLNGIIIINKPQGFTSFDVVAKLRGILKTKRIGHGGTLDPMATGVLPIFIGRATRAVEFCQEFDKEYIAGITFGITTDTQDLTGKILKSYQSSIDAEDIKKVIPRFLGEQKQIPPMYSAIKIGGKKLYDLARKGIEIERQARTVYINELELIGDDEMRSADLVIRPDCLPNEFDVKSVVAPDIFDYSNKESVLNLSNNKSKNPDSLLKQSISKYVSDTVVDSNSYFKEFFLRAVCSKGTYIRTLCSDIGNALGCGATMSSLVRTRVGKYKIDKAYSFDDISKAVKLNMLGELDLLLPIDDLFDEYPKIELDASDTRKHKNGVICNVDDIVIGARNGKYRVYSKSGEFLTISECKDSVLKTIKSFCLPTS